MECRVRNSINLLNAFEAFLRSLDPLPDRFHGMDAGTLERPEMVKLHDAAKLAKAALKAQYDLFWSPPLEVNLPRI